MMDISVPNNVVPDAIVGMSSAVAEPAGKGEEGKSDRDRRVKWNQKETHEFDDTNLWTHDPNETATEMISCYRRLCANNKVRPITRLLEQLERFDDLSIPMDTLDLKGVKLDNTSCEVLEAVLSRIHMNTLDLERCNLEDEGAIALCEMIEFYGCASRVNLSNNSKLRPRAWLTIGRMLKKSPFLSMINVSWCSLEEQTLTLLLRSVRANCSLSILKMEGNNLSGKGTFILMAAMKFNENLQEIWLGNNSLVTEDGQHLGNILRTNHCLKVLDLRDNSLGDAGVKYICAGVSEQAHGLLTLNLRSNSIGPEGFHHVATMLPATKTVRELNLSNNRCGDNGLFTLKLGLLANRALEKLNLSNTKMTCEGAIALAEVLAESKHLTHVDIRENDIRVAGLMALQLAHRMNFHLISMQTPKAFKVEQRDRQLIRDLLAEIEKYSSRNQHKKEEKAEAERRRLHEQQHSAIPKGNPEEQGTFTAGGNQRTNQRTTVLPSQASVDDEEKDIDPSIVGSLDNVYSDEPEMTSEDDPFKKVPVMDERDKPSTLQEMEKSMDAVVEYSEQGVDTSMELLGSDDELSSLDQGSRGLPDIIGGPENTPPPDVTSQEPRSDLAAVDLLEAGEPSAHLVDLTDSLGQS